MLSLAASSVGRATPRPVWAWKLYRISPPRFLAECRKRRLNQSSFFAVFYVVSFFLSYVQIVYCLIFLYF